MRTIAILACAIMAATTTQAAAQADRPGSTLAAVTPSPDQERPIAAVDEVWIERLTWMEVRDAIKAGKTTAIIPTGGVEQNGPYLVTGKHNVILQATAEAIARRLGDTLVAPIVPFVPQGGIEPTTDAMLYPGTFGVENETFRALLRDIARSLRAHDFRHIVFIGDSGGNQQGQKDVAAELTRAWVDEGVRVVSIDEYYDWPGRQQWLAERGHREVDEGLHDELSATAIMMGVDPASVRAEQRIATGRFSINGVALAPMEDTTALGRALVEHIAEVTAQAIRETRD